MRIKNLEHFFQDLISGAAERGASPHQFSTGFFYPYLTLLRELLPHNDNDAGITVPTIILLQDDKQAACYHR